MNIRRVVLTSLLSLIPLIAAASWREAVPQALLVGEGQLRFFGLRIYGAKSRRCKPVRRSRWN